MVEMGVKSVTLVLGGRRQEEYSIYLAVLSTKLEI